MLEERDPEVEWRCEGFVADGTLTVLPGDGRRHPMCNGTSSSEARTSSSEPKVETAGENRCDIWLVVGDSAEARDWNATRTQAG
jgi:hypothetical protein